MLSQKLPSAFTTGSTRTRLGLLTGYISASVSLGLCFAMIKDHHLRVPESMTVKQTVLQSAHAALQKDMDALQEKLDHLTRLYSGVETKDAAAVLMSILGMSESSATSGVSACGLQSGMTPSYWKPPMPRFVDFSAQILFSDAFSVVVMVILSFKLLTPIFSTFNLGSTSRGVVRCRKYFKL